MIWGVFIRNMVFLHMECGVSSYGILGKFIWNVGLVHMECGIKLDCQLASSVCMGAYYGMRDVHME